MLVVEEIEVLEKLLKKLKSDLKEEEILKKEVKRDVINMDRLILLSVNNNKCDLYRSSAKNMVDAMIALCEIVGAYNLSRKFPDMFSKDRYNFPESARKGAREVQVENTVYYLNTKNNTEEKEKFINEIQAEYPYIKIDYKIIFKYA